MKFNNLLLAAALTAAAMATAFSIPTQAADLPTIEATSGADKGSYAKFMGEVSDVCHEDVTLHITLSPGGSEMNVDRLNQNDAAVGLAQADYLWWASQTQDMSTIKVLLPLFSEQLHFATLRESKHMVGGHLGVGQKPLQLNSVTDLQAGTTLAASGGAKTTALLVAKQAGLGYQMVPTETSAVALKMLVDGQVDAVLVVGAQPMDLFRNAPPASKALIKFLPIPENLLPVLKGYSPAKVGYSGIGDGSSVQTVAVQSDLITQNYSSKQAIAKSVHALKQCLLDKAPDQAGIAGRHPAWRAVRADAESKWPQWDDPFSSSAQAVAAPVKAKKK
jgi:TRAP-type uncharacterized transport system substrate-binding protein